MPKPMKETDKTIKTPIPVIAAQFDPKAGSVTNKRPNNKDFGANGKSTNKRYTARGK